MITTKVYFKDEEAWSREVSFLILPKLGETICYHSGGNCTDFVVDNIVHKVNGATNTSAQLLEIHVSRPAYHNIRKPAIIENLAELT